MTRTTVSELRDRGIFVYPPASFLHLSNRRRCIVGYRRSRIRKLPAGLVSFRDVLVLTVRFRLKPRLFPRQAVSHARPSGQSDGFRPGEDGGTLLPPIDLINVTVRPAAAPR